jgi:hypothetical protein
LRLLHGHQDLPAQAPLSGDAGAVHIHMPRILVHGTVNVNFVNGFVR